MTKFVEGQDVGPDVGPVQDVARGGLGEFGRTSLGGTGRKGVSDGGD